MSSVWTAEKIHTQFTHKVLVVWVIKTNFSSLGHSREMFIFLKKRFLVDTFQNANERNLKSYFRLKKP